LELVKQHAHPRPPVLLKVHAHRQRRRRGRVAHLALTAAAFGLLVLTLPLQQPRGAVLGTVSDISASRQTPDTASASVGTTSKALDPILEALLVKHVAGRPTTTGPQASARSILRRASSGTRAVFLGDSYTTGWNGAGIRSRGWPRLVGRQMNWQTVNLAVAGTGFINPGWTNQPVRSRLATAIRARPDVVFVAAGHNDSRWSAADTAAAAEVVIDRLRAALPRATLVVIGPIWPNAGPPTRCLILRDRLRRKAAAVGAIFIDPLAEGWFAGTKHQYIMADGIHPTDGGHRWMAERVLAHLARAG